MPNLTQLAMNDTVFSIALAVALLLVLMYTGKRSIKAAAELPYKEKLAKEAKQRLGFNRNLSAEQANINIEKQRKKIEAAKKLESTEQTHTSSYCYHYQQEVLAEMLKLYKQKFPIEPCAA